MTKKIVITGGAGFIGSHLAHALVMKGLHVTIVDNLSQGKRERCPEGATLEVADIRDKEKITSVMRDTDTVFHLAAVPRVPYSIEHPEETNDVNITGTLAVLLAARDAGVRRVVYAASSSAYGEQIVLPLHEELPANPLHPYGIQKYVGELYTKIFHTIYGLETVALRFFNVYGLYQNPDGPYAGAIPKFLSLCKSKKTLPVVGDGEQTRDFTNVRDVISALILAMESPNVGKGEVINVGAGRNVSVLELAKLIGGEIEFLPARTEAKDSLADITKAKKLLGWEPKINLEEGIRELKLHFGIVD